MIIRFLTQADVSEHEKVASQAFVFSTDIHDPAAELPCEKVLGAFDDDNKTLFADLELYDRTCYYDGGLLSCAAIGGVAAKPEHRGKGAVKALFDAVYSDDRYVISILYPFSEAYYRKLGYERTGLSLSATIPFSELSAVCRNQDAVLYEGENTKRLLEIYNRCAKRYNLCFARDTAEAFPDRPYLSNSYTYIWKNNAFATFSVNREKSTVFVKELYFDSCASMRGIVGFLRNYEANQKKVCFQNVPANTPLLHHVGDLKKCEITVYNTGAARVLNPEKVLRTHRYPAGEDTFTVQIGNDVYHVTYSDKNVTVDKNGPQAPDVILGFARASQILLCGCADGSYLPDVEIRNPDTCFFRAFPPRTVFFSDNL